MYRSIIFLCLMPMVACASDWPCWRGPTGQGISEAPNVPIHWSATSKVVWKSAVPGEGCDFVVACELTALDKQLHARALHAYVYSCSCMQLAMAHMHAQLASTAQSYMGSEKTVHGNVYEASRSSLTHAK